MSKNQLLPIAVDLDGTLVNTDTLYECCLQLLHNHCLQIFLLPFWLIHGKAYLKQKVSERVNLNITTLPYNLELISWLKNQKVLGHQIILITAANYLVAHAIANHLKLFDEVIASKDQINMAGLNKRQHLVERYGEKQFIYVGNSKIDLKVWQSAAQAVVVNASADLNKKVASLTDTTKTFPSPAITPRAWRQVLRIHQYFKNILLFVPIIAAHQSPNIQSINLLFLAFVSFSLCASSVYIINDLFDLESDRQHPQKCFRPFAAGIVSIKYGVILASICLLASVAIASLVGNHFLIWLITYIALTYAYSLKLKRLVIIDCLVLATLYTLRIIAGAAAISIALSFWLLAFSIFLFLSLSFVKRYGELAIHILKGATYAHGRGYHVSDASLIQTLGITAGYTAVLLLALYLNSETVMNLYAAPQLIWLTIPIMLFWISWMWLKAHRGEMHHDPIQFALQDKASLVSGLLLLIIYTLATNYSMTYA